MSEPMEERGVNPNKLELRSPFRHAANKYIPLDRRQQFVLAKEIWDTFGELKTAIEGYADYAVTGVDVVIDEKEGSKYKDGIKAAKQEYEDLYETDLNISSFMKKCIVNERLFGSAIPSFNFEARKIVKCPVCEHRHRMELKRKDDDSEVIEYNGEYLDAMPEQSWDYTTANGEPQFSGRCSRCDSNVTYRVYEEKQYRASKLKLIALDITRITMEWVPITDSRRYWYEPDKRTIKEVTAGNKWVISQTPLNMLRAIAVGGKSRLIEDTFYHIESADIAQSSVAWPMPGILRSFFSLFYIASLRAATESIAATQIAPFVAIWPNDNAAFLGKPGGLMFRRFRSIMQDNYRKWSDNPKFLWVSPIPISFTRIGGDGKMMIPTQETEIAWQNAFLAQGIPRGLLTGDVTWAGNHIAMRIFQNGVNATRTGFQRFINKLQQCVETNLEYLPKARVKLKPFKEIDDTFYKQMAIQCTQMGVSSNQKLCEIMDWDHETMVSQREDETRKRMEFESELRKKNAIDEAKANLEFQKVMMAETSGQMVGQAQEYVKGLVTTIDNMNKQYGVPVEKAIDMLQFYQNMMMMQQQQQMMQMQAMQAQQAFLDQQSSSAMNSVNRAAKSRTLFDIMSPGGMPGGQVPASQIMLGVLSQIPDQAVKDSILKALSAVDPALYTAVYGAMGMPAMPEIPGMNSGGEESNGAQ